MVESHFSRNIIVLCDGTGKNGHVDKEDSQTNVWRLYQAIEANKPECDVVVYVPGVGTSKGVKPNFGDILARTLGHTSVETIKSIYMRIVQEYRPGDNLSLFGYSRGAFIVRKVASLIDKLGLVSDPNELHAHWTSLEHKLPGKRNAQLPSNSKRVPISCLGVWDTVGSVFSPKSLRPQLDLLSLPDNDLPRTVESALHVLAYHENRRLFNATLFDSKSEQNQCVQMCFPGSHSDVGGGGAGVQKAVMPAITLGWMMENLPCTIHIPENAIPRMDPELVLTFDLIQDAFRHSPVWKRLPDRLSPRNYLKKAAHLPRHQTLQGLPTPAPPGLLDIEREYVVLDKSELEGMPSAPNGAAESFVSELEVKKANPSVSDVSTSEKYEFPAPPSMESSTTSASGLQVQTQRPEYLTPSANRRVDSTSTQQTMMSLSVASAVSTPRTSVYSSEYPLQPHSPALSTIKDDCPPSNAPESPNNAPAIQDTPNAPVPVVLSEPVISEKVEPKETAPSPKVQEPSTRVAPKPRKKGILKRVGGYLRVAFCCA